MSGVFFVSRAHERVRATEQRLAERRAASGARLKPDVEAVEKVLFVWNFRMK